MSWRNYLKSQSTPLYTEDWIGLKRLDNEDKLHFMSVEVSREHKIQPDITQLLDVWHVLMCLLLLTLIFAGRPSSAGQGFSGRNY